MNIFKGVGVALVTPFRTDGTINFETLGRLIAYQLERGIDYLCVLGTTSESPCLSLEEKRLVKSFVIEQVKGKVPILLGCGGNCTAEVVRFIQEEDLTGVDGLLIVSPYYNKPTQEGLYRHFEAIASVSQLPIVLYNVPGRTGMNLEPATALRLARAFDNIVAIKEAAGNIVQAQELLLNKPEGFDVISGDDGITFEMIANGAVGVISVIGNALPEEFSGMVHQALRGEYTEALAMHHKLNKLFKLMIADGNPAGVKTLLSELGLAENILRLPLVPASDKTKTAIREELARLK